MRRISERHTARMPGGRRVDHALGQDRREQLEPRRHDRHRRRDREARAHRPHERAHPREIEVLDRRVVQLGRRAERRAPPAPLLVDLGAVDAPQAAARVGHPHAIAVDGVEDDPVVALPVEDRRQLQLVQAVLGRLERVALESRLLGSAHDPAQARALLARAGDVPDERQRDLAAERAADHRERRDAAVGEVDLTHEREATGRDPRLGRRRFSGDVHAGGDALVGRRRRRRRTLADARGHVAAAEVERPHRDAAEVQPSPVAEPRGEHRIERAELVEHGRVELEQSAVARGGHGRQARAALERADLAEHIAGRAGSARRGGPSPRPVCSTSRPDSHDPPATGGSPSRTMTSPSRALSPRPRATMQLDALRVELPERLVRAQERRDPLGVRLLRERRRGLGVRAGEGDRDAAVEPQHAHRARGGAQGDTGRVVLDERRARRSISPGPSTPSETSVRSAPLGDRRAPRPRRRRRTRCPPASTRSRRSDTSAPRSRRG